MKLLRYATLLMSASMVVGLTGCGYFRLKVDPPKVSKDQTATISATLQPGMKDVVKFAFEVTDGKECGGVDPASQDTANGLAQVTFKPSSTVATSCSATITATDPNGNKKERPLDRGACSRGGYD